MRSNPSANSPEFPRHLAAQLLRETKSWGSLLPPSHRAKTFAPCGLFSVKDSREFILVVKRQPRKHWETWEQSCCPRRPLVGEVRTLPPPAFVTPLAASGRHGELVMSQRAKCLRMSNRSEVPKPKFSERKTPPLRETLGPVFHRKSCFQERLRPAHLDALMQLDCSLNCTFSASSVQPRQNVIAGSTLCHHESKKTIYSLYS